MFASQYYCMDNVFETSDNLMSSFLDYAVGSDSQIMVSKSQCRISV